MFFSYALQSTRGRLAPFLPAPPPRCPLDHPTRRARRSTRHDHPPSWASDSPCSTVYFEPDADRLHSDFVSRLIKVLAEPKNRKRGFHKADLRALVEKVGKGRYKFWYNYLVEVDTSGTVRKLKF